MNELDLLLLRLEDLTESAEDKEVKILSKALLRYFKKADMGFKGDEK